MKSSASPSCAFQDSYFECNQNWLSYNSNPPFLILELNYVLLHGSSWLNARQTQNGGKENMAIL